MRFNFSDNIFSRYIGLILAIMIIFGGMNLLSILQNVSFNIEYREEPAIFFKKNGFLKEDVKNNYIFDNNNIISTKKKEDLNKKAKDIYKNKGVKTYFIYYKYKSDLHNKNFYFNNILNYILEIQSSEKAPTILYLYDIQDNHFSIYQKNVPDDTLHINKNNKEIINNYMYRENIYNKESFFKNFEDTVKHIEDISNIYLTNEIKKDNNSQKLDTTISTLSIIVFLYTVFRYLSNKTKKERC